MTIGIYRIYNINNNNTYIGQSKNILNRYEAHKKDLRNNKHHCYKLQKEYNKLYKQLDNEYKDNTMYKYLDISKMVIDKCYKLEILKEFKYYNVNELLKIEDEYILKYRNIQSGYNQSTNIELQNKEYEILNYTKLHYPELYNYICKLSSKDFEEMKHKYNIDTKKDDEIRYIFLNDKELMNRFICECMGIGIRYSKEYIDKHGEPKYIE